MSNREDVLIAPWEGPSSYNNSLTIVVVSDNGTLVQKLSEAIVDVHEQGFYQWKLAILRCFSLEDIVKQSNYTGRVGFDFIVICLDTSKLFCIKWATTFLDQVHPDLRFRRVILVNATGLAVSRMAVDAYDIMSFCTHNRIDMMNADVMKPDEAQYIAQRIINYMEVSVGVKTGIPNINI
ncbi:uncharacterized protein LOC126974146 [Leptidea sinapis]|uniref:uncharacterized protein LOC126974146 n=1 Tax=Leptidea sinapis TaxID=189913 RepID=UPI0021C2FCA1|nr:uncharacterized protein LOC126974146 [Leptidea sinapis]